MPTSKTPRKRVTKVKGRTRDRRATEDALLLAAGQLFAQKGYENTRTLEIAKEAGVNEALILRYFGGKEGLLAAILSNDEALQRLMSHGPCVSETDAIPIDGKRCSLKSALTAFYANGEQMVAVKEPFMRIATSRALVDEKIAKVVRQKLIDRQIPLLRDCLQKFFKAQGKPIEARELDSMVVLLASTNFSMNFMARRVYRVDEDKIDSTLDFLTDVLDHYFSR